MKTIIITMIFALLLVGCKDSETKSQLAEESSDVNEFWFTPKGVVYASEQALWLQTCAFELAFNQRNQRNKKRWFNGIGANDVIFIPWFFPAGEIFRKCKSVKPLSADKSSLYKKWLKERIVEIQSINAGTTRGKVNQLLVQNGGIFTPRAAIYSHRECPVLKVRIEFKPISNDYARYPFNENDKVKAVSMPYLGLFTAD